MLSWSDLLNPLPGRLSISPITSPTHTQPCHPSPASQPSPQIGLNILSTSYDVELNWQTTLDILYKYGPGTHMEYPATKYDGHVGHLFTGLDIENWVNPMAYFTYSLGPPKGSNKNGSCNILLGDEGVRVPCHVTHFTCMYIVLNKCLVLNFEYPKAKVERFVHTLTLRKLKSRIVLLLAMISDSGLNLKDTHGKTNCCHLLVSFKKHLRCGRRSAQLDAEVL